MSCSDGPPGSVSSGIFLEVIGRQVVSVVWGALRRAHEQANALETRGTDSC